MNEKQMQKYSSVSVKALVKYLSGEAVVDKYNKSEYDRAIKLKRMIDIFDSEESDYSKLYEMNQVYGTTKSFLRAFNGLGKYEKDAFLKEYIEKWKEIYSFYHECEAKGIVSDVNQLMSIQNYFYSYDYARFLISSYVTSNDSFNTIKFLEDFGIDQATFDFCVNVINELDPNLYALYSNKTLENRNKRIENTRNAVDNMVCGIKTGYLLDGTPFDEVEFLKLIPFSDQQTARELLNDFGAKQRSEFSSRIRSLLTTINPDECDTIIRYMGEHSMDSLSFRPLDMREIYNTKFIVSGREITSSDKDIILSYISENSLPMVYKSFDAVRKKYLNGEITKDDVKEKKYIPPFKCTLVP